MEIKLVTEHKKDYLPLLLMADPCENMIDRYLETGDLFVLFEDEKPASVAVVNTFNEAECELKNLATSEASQGRGYASELVRHVFRFYQKRFQAMYVGTSESMTPFYERFGFAFSHIVKNFFTDNYPEPIFEDGRQCIDMVYLKKKL